MGFISHDRLAGPDCFIGVVKKTLRYSYVFFYNPLCRNSVIHKIIMESGKTESYRVVLAGFGFGLALGNGRFIFGVDPIQFFLNLIRSRLWLVVFNNVERFLIGQFSNIL